jgi:NADH-quinone oxidoreductase subunit M
VRTGAGGDLKRLIAYSSVGHMGFVLLGIATLTPSGVNGALFANIAHGIITGLLFFLVGAVKERTGTTDLDRLADGGGARLYGGAPRLGGLLAFTAVASLGLPGLAGFWGEMLALFGALQPDGALNRPMYLVLMVIAGIGAVLTAAYFLQLIRRLCQGDDAIGVRLGGVADVTRAEVVTWAPLVVLTIVLGLYPGAILSVTDPAVHAVMGLF